MKVRYLSVVVLVVMAVLLLGGTAFGTVPVFTAADSVFGYVGDGLAITAALTIEDNFRTYYNRSGGDASRQTKPTWNNVYACSMWVYLDVGTGGSQNVRLAAYDTTATATDSADFLWRTEERVISNSDGDGWYGFEVETPWPAVVNGRSYMLVAWCSNNASGTCSVHRESGAPTTPYAYTTAASTYGTYPSKLYHTSINSYFLHIVAQCTDWDGSATTSKKKKTALLGRWGTQ